MEWKCIDDEWPPMDGCYLVTNSPESEEYVPLSGLATYDGFGFFSGERYVHARYWTPYTPPVKRYGKVS